MSCHAENLLFIYYFQVSERKKVKSLSRVQLFATPWTVAYQAPPSMGFSRQEYWSGLPLPVTFARKREIPWGFPGSSGFTSGSDGKESACNAGDLVSIPG